MLQSWVVSNLCLSTAHGSCVYKPKSTESVRTLPLGKVGVVQVTTASQTNWALRVKSAGVVQVTYRQRTPSGRLLHAPRVLSSSQADEWLRLVFAPAKSPSKVTARTLLRKFRCSATTVRCSCSAARRVLGNTWWSCETCKLFCAMQRKTTAVLFYLFCPP